MPEFLNDQSSSAESSSQYDARYSHDDGGSVTLNPDRFGHRRESSERGRARTISSIAPLPESCYTINTFLFFLICFQLTNLLTLTYTSSVLNYIAKAFNIPNTMASFIPASYQISSMVVLIPVSFFGGKWNRPRAIGVGVMVMAVGLACCALPHFISPASKLSNVTESNMCILNKTAAKADNIVYLPSGLPCNKDGNVENPALLLIIGNILIGGGASPIWPLGISYIDDHVIIRKAPLYMGIFIGTSLSGPVFGFLLGSLTSSIYVNLNAHGLSPSSPTWIGAWWLGYLVACLLLIVLLFPFYFYPRSLPISAQKQAELAELEILQERKDQSLPQTKIEAMESISSHELSSETSSIPGCSNAPCELNGTCQYTFAGRIIANLKEVACAIKMTLSTPLVLTCICAYIAMANILSGLGTFGPSYVQTTYNLLRTMADALIGGVCLPLGILGTFIGGYILKKYSLDIRQSLKFTVVMSGLGCLFIFAVMFIGCPLQQIVGLQHSNRSCASKCHCTVGEFHLICGSNNLTYLSPCHAGCLEMQIKNEGFLKSKETYSNCSCIDDTQYSAVGGACSTRSCSVKFAGFMILACFAVFMFCLCQAPVYVIMLRVINMEHKALAIGLMSFFSRVLGSIPAPIWFGMILDKSCTYWSAKCMGKSTCLFYNAEGLRFSFIGVILAWGCIYCIVFTTSFVWMEFHKDKYDKTIFAMPDSTLNNNSETETSHLLR
ncbi:unnamed protein product [Clavelina lepadiformis]|uniref:Solute carrier organic anion transporter family member n=1 Tax=Clavelina lepadiformis TaxID=159417 RepID=A0ABP0F8Q1_CLALP